MGRVVCGDGKIGSTPNLGPSRAGARPLARELEGPGGRASGVTGERGAGTRVEFVTVFANRYFLFTSRSLAHRFR